MEKNDFWWYAIPFSLGVIVSLTLTWYGYYERTSSEQTVEESVKVIETVATENMKTDVPVGKIKCVHTSTLGNRFCEEYVIYRTIGE